MPGALRQDLRSAVGSLRRARGSAVVAALTIAVGIAGNVAVFSVVDALLLRPLPYPDSATLISLWETFPVAGSAVPGRGTVSVPNYLDWRERVTRFAAIGAWAESSHSLTGGEGAAEPVESARVTPSLLRVLGVGALLGRTLQEPDAAAGADRTVLLSHALWRRRFAAERAVVGSTVASTASRTGWSD